MAILDFPLEPGIGQRYASGDKTWYWNGEAWILVREFDFSLIGNTPTTLQGYNITIDDLPLTGDILISRNLGNNIGTLSADLITKNNSYQLPDGSGVIALNDPLFGGTGQTSYIKGDILYASSTSNLSKLGIGSEGNVLLSINGIPQWTDISYLFASEVEITSVIISNTAPANPASGNIWWDSINGTLRVYYNDGDSSQWVEAVNAQGQQGDAATIDVGDVVTLNPGSSVIIENSGTPGEAVFDFGLPRGSVVTLADPQPTNLNPGELPFVTNTGTNGDVVLNFSLPRTAGVSVGSTSTLLPGSTATVTNSGTGGDVVLNFGVPRGSTAGLGILSVLNPDQQPTLTNTGINGNLLLNFGLPRGPSVTLGTVSTLNPNQNPSIAEVNVNGDKTFNFSIPRAASISIGNVTTLVSGSSATVTNSGANGDINLNFGIPRGTGITSINDNNNGTITISYGDGETQVFSPVGYFPATAGDEGQVLISLGGSLMPTWASIESLLSDSGLAATDGIWDLNYSEQTGIEVKPYASVTANNAWVSDNANGGKFYLGTQNPTKETRLNYNGHMYATRVFNPVYNDLAEFMYVVDGQNLIPGDVVSSTKDGLVKAQKGDRNVVGVYSDTFGYALGADDQDKKIPVGISGRVLVKVIGPDPVPGDLLIAGTNGYAEVNNEPRIGTVIGKIFDGIKHEDGRFWMLIMNG